MFLAREAPGLETPPGPGEPCPAAAAAPSPSAEEEAAAEEEEEEEEEQQPPPQPPPDLRSWSKEELVRRLRREESARLAALVQRGRLMQGVNRQLQEHLREVRELKAANGRLQAENRELRDLCCFLDEDRLKAKRLGRHWQLFGQHAAQVLRDQVAACLRKLAGLEDLQERLALDNLALKELCLALEEEAAAAAGIIGGPGGPTTTNNNNSSSSTGGLLSPAGPPGVGLVAPPGSELSLPCGPRDLGDGSSSTGSLGSPDQIHPACSPDED